MKYGHSKTNLSRVMVPAFFAVIMMLLIFPSALMAGDALLDVRLIAHRGLHVEHPENSMGAIQAAIGSGIHGTEIDLRTTRDGHLVIIHDENLKRTTTGTGKVKDMAWKDLKDLKLKGPDGKATQWGIPDFDQVLELVKEHPGFGLALDMKDVDPVQVAKQVLKHDMAGQTQFFVADPMDTELVRTIKGVDKRLRVTVDMLTWWKIEDVPCFAANALEADALFASEWFFPKAGFGQLNEEGVPVIVYLWGKHDLEKRFHHAVELGANSVSCDNPLALLPYVHPLKNHKAM